MDTEKIIEHYKPLKDCPCFETIDRESEYDERLIFCYREETDEEELEGKIFVPFNEQEYPFHWSFDRYKKIGSDMFVLDREVLHFEQTPDWFQQVAKPIHAKIRLFKVLGLSK